MGKKKHQEIKESSDNSRGGESSSDESDSDLDIEEFASYVSTLPEAGDEKEKYLRKYVRTLCLGSLLFHLPHSQTRFQLRRRNAPRATHAHATHHTTPHQQHNTTRDTHHNTP